MFNKMLQATLMTALCLTATHSFADPREDLDTMVRGNYDRSELNERGYQWSAQVGSGSHRAEFWYNADNDSCAKLVINDDIIAQVDNAKSKKCTLRNRHDYQPSYQAAAASNDERIDPNLMPRYCSGEAASKFHVSPRDITTLPMEKQGHNYVVYGQWEQDDIHTFTCTFSRNAQLESLKRTS